MNELIGQSRREALYCGHRVWAAYTSKTGKPVEAGGVVTVRSEWVNKETGELEHRIKEYRIDPVHGDPHGIAKTLAGVECGVPVELELGTIESARGTQWQNLIGVALLSVDA